MTLTVHKEDTKYLKETVCGKTSEAVIKLRVWELVTCKSCLSMREMWDKKQTCAEILKQRK